MTTPLVACVGIATLDIVLSVDELPTRAGKHRARSRLAVGGGVAANAAVTAVRLGGRASLATRLGDDDEARRIAAGLADEGVATDVGVRPGEASPLSVVLVTPDGERTIVNHAGTGLFDGTPVPDPPADAAAVLADMRWPTAADRFLSVARARGIPGVLDCDHDPSGAEAVLEAASHLVFAWPTLAAYVGTDDRHAALRRIRERSGGWVAATAGGDGVFWLDGDEMRHLPALDVPVVDTLAAGDVFHGAFALALAEGQGEAEALRFATVAAAVKCTRFGGRAAIPVRDEVERAMQELG